ncbi:MAG: hypothetical protein R2941_13505 [Desulfobacterales bacterium]
MNPAMNNSVVSIDLPFHIYSELLSLQTDDAKEPPEIIARLVKDAHHHLAWIHDLSELRNEIRKQGGLYTGKTEEEMIERLRKDRKEIFETEYSHLY